MARRKHRMRNRRPRSRGKSSSIQAGVSPAIEDDSSEELWSFEIDGEQNISLRSSEASLNRATKRWPLGGVMFDEPLRSVGLVGLGSMGADIGAFNELRGTLRKPEYFKLAGGLEPLRTLSTQAQPVGSVQRIAMGLERDQRNSLSALSVFKPMSRDTGGLNSMQRAVDGFQQMQTRSMGMLGLGEQLIQSSGRHEQFIRGLDPFGLFRK